MDSPGRCDDEFWGARCDKQRGHLGAHSGVKGDARITWGSALSPPAGSLAVRHHVVASEQ